MHLQTLLRRWQWLLALLLTGLTMAPPSAFANEFIRAHKVFLKSKVFETGDEAAKDAAEQYCKGQYVRDCSAVWTGEVWSSGNSSWYWTGTLTYTHSSGAIETTPISGAILYSCIEGWGAYDLPNKSNLCSRPDTPAPSCEKCKNSKQSPQVGNPIAVADRIKIQVEEDYRNAAGTLVFVRTYRSDEGRWLHNYQVSGVDYQVADLLKTQALAAVCGRNPTLDKYECQPYAGKGTAYSFTLRRGAGRRVDFGGAQGYQAPLDVQDRITPILDASGVRSGSSVTNESARTTELFSLNGYLLSSTDANGLVTTYMYSDDSTPPTTAPYAGLLVKVQDPFGQSLAFTYDAQGRMASLIDPAGGVVTYEYDAQSNLTKVTYPDGKSKTYVYNELAKTANVARTNALTGIIDENGSRYATFAYDGNAQAISTEHAGGVEKYALTFPSYANTVVVDPLGASYSYTYYNMVGMRRTTYMSRPGAGGVGTVSATNDYDANANITTFTDFDGTVTSYTYDLVRNLETRRVEALGKTVARTISTEWHAAFRLPLRIAEALRRTTYTYDAVGNVLTKTVQATSDANGASGFSATLVGAPRTWTYTYSTLGQLLTVTGPRTDVADTTTYTYDEHGNLATVTNALGHVTTLSNYDAHGRAGRITDPNGLMTDFVYTPRGWLSSTTVGSATTSYGYDNAGQLTSVTMPGGATLNYTYDLAHRLTAMSDGAGNSVQYTLDNMGNRISEQIKDVNGTLMRQIARVYDSLNRLKQITGAQQ